ncbi:helix-turn-helix domain-containing protein [Rhodococcus zopfii]|uniref:Helix-turn-helix domain-containing protein n=1 Tax=Rhodococcus zopfii TaxID=43772 RepID=A0ABU3WV09_9NOCA|nr:helix-turn-helix domain-containing protein [Rhodococcus zopfii]
MTTQRLDTDALLLTGDSITAVRYAVRVAIAARKRNGLPVPAPLTELAAVTAEPGRTDTEPEPAQHHPHDMIDTREAAAILGCSNRQARRLAPGLDGQLIGGRWLIPRHAVTEHQEGTAA